MTARLRVLPLYDGTDRHYLVLDRAGDLATEGTFQQLRGAVEGGGGVPLVFAREVEIPSVDEPGCELPDEEALVKAAEAWRRMTGHVDRLDKPASMD